uniref:Tudor domain-containing protein n=1 Tax=Rhabditophanes sp. KR3021 TaxID=114890 RepID=A0AC35UGI9_9BILA
MEGQDSLRWKQQLVETSAIRQKKDDELCSRKIKKDASTRHGVLNIPSTKQWKKPSSVEKNFGLKAKMFIITDDVIIKNEETVNKKTLTNSGITSKHERVHEKQGNIYTIRTPIVDTENQMKVVNIISPHLIFMKRANSTADTLNLVLPCDIKPIVWVEASDVDSGDPTRLSTATMIGTYVMAPLNENVYARSRIIDCNKSRTFVKLIFIDYGRIIWANIKCLAAMDIERFKVRWQTLRIGLKNIHPKAVAKKDANAKCIWEKEHITALQEFLSTIDLTYFSTLTTLKKIYTRDILMVDLFEYNVEFENSQQPKRFKKLIEDVYYRVNINQALVQAYPHLFSRLDFDQMNYYDATHDCIDMYPSPETSTIPHYLSEFPIIDYEKLSNGQDERNTAEQDGGHQVDFWSLKKLLDNNFIKAGKFIRTFLFDSLGDHHQLRLGGMIFNNNEKFKEGEFFTKLIYNKRKAHLDRIRAIHDQYKTFGKNDTFKIDAVIEYWKNQLPFYIMCPVKISPTETRLLRSEVVGFCQKKVVRGYEYILKVRYLDINGTDRCFLHEVFKMTKDASINMPIIANFVIEKMLIRNNLLPYNDKLIKRFVRDLIKKIPRSEVIVVELSEKNNITGYPNTNIFSNNTSISHDVFRTDLIIENMYLDNGQKIDLDSILDDPIYATFFENHEKNNEWEYEKTYTMQNIEEFTFPSVIGAFTHPDAKSVY